MTTIPDVTFDPTNPDPRCACILILDTSGSMHGEKINQLNQGLVAFRDWSKYWPRVHAVAPALTSCHHAVAGRRLCRCQALACDGRNEL